MSIQNIDRPLVVSPNGAARLLDCGRTKLYALIRGGQLVSYVDGPKARKILVSSIEDYVKRQLAEQARG